MEKAKVEVARVSCAEAGRTNSEEVNRRHFFVLINGHSFLTQQYQTVPGYHPNHYKVVVRQFFLFIMSQWL
jgi:hypothetical protein